MNNKIAKTAVIEFEGKKAIKIKLIIKMEL